jgi:hypothetical protein
MTTGNQLLRDLIAAYDADDGFALSIAVEALRATQPAEGGTVLEAGEIESIDTDEDGQESAWVKLTNPLPLGTKLYTAQPASHVPEADFGNNQPARQEPCKTCRGHGLIGGFMQDGSGYGEGCPDGNPEPKASQEQAQQPSGGEVVAWRLRAPVESCGLQRFMTQAKYEKQTPAIQKWYEPFKCQNCATPKLEPR